MGPINNEMFRVNKDGSVSTLSDNSHTQQDIAEIENNILNYIRVGANTRGRCAALNAERRAIKYAKSVMRRLDTKEYVLGLILTHFPLEFKLADLGCIYKKLKIIASVYSLILILSFCIAVFAGIGTDFDEEFIWAFIVFCLIAVIGYVAYRCYWKKKYTSICSEMDLILNKKYI